jgi:hypothetical protein
MLVLIENSRSCAGKWLYNNRLWFSSREFTTLKGIISGRALTLPRIDTTDLPKDSKADANEWTRKVSK